VDNFIGLADSQEFTDDYINKSGFHVIDDKEIEEIKFHEKRTEVKVQLEEFLSMEEAELEIDPQDPSISCYLQLIKFCQHAET
jgi:hypothetical protein